MPANFRTFESQSRLLAAVIASHPGLKLDFKEIARCYGSDTTASSIDHRLRPVKRDVKAIHDAVKEGLDPLNLNIGGGGGLASIASHFGDSTPQGIEFQFRNIKKEAKALKDAVANGQDVSAIKTGSTKYREYKKRGGEDDAGSDDSEFKTPVKKDSNKRVMNGRVGKTPTKQKNIKAESGASSRDPVLLEDDDDIDMACSTPTKSAGNDQFFANSTGNISTGTGGFDPYGGSDTYESRVDEEADEESHGNLETGVHHTDDHFENDDYVSGEVGFANVEEDEYYDAV